VLIIFAIVSVLLTPKSLRCVLKCSQVFPGHAINLSLIAKASQASQQATAVRAALPDVPFLQCFYTLLSVVKYASMDLQGQPWLLL